MFKDLKKEFPSTLFLLLILIVGSIYFFKSSMDVYPSYIHAWTQSDRLAIAMQFQENGFDFLHPATYNLYTKDGITQVDFPIHDYLVALSSKVFNWDIISTFRWYNLLYSLIGWIFLFRFCLLLKLSPTRSLFVSIFFFTLPFLVYYQNGFLPSVPSLANFIIALFFLAKYGKSSSLSSLILATFFLLLAALSRIPFTIFLVALSIAFLKDIKEKRISPIHLLFPVFAILLVIAYWFYNKSLGEEYGSMFLSETMHFTSIQNSIDVLSKAFDNWSKEILSPFHWIIFSIFLLLYVFSKNIKNNSYSPFWKNYFVISLAGVLAYFFLLGNQFADHDYYYIDSFIPILILLFVLMNKKIIIPAKWYSFIGFICLLFSFYFFSFSKSIVEKRYTPTIYDRTHYSYEVYEKSKSLIEPWGIAKEDTLVFLDVSSTNIPFTVWKRKGYTALGSDKKLTNNILNNEHDYVLMIDSFFRSDGYQDYPELIDRLELLNTNFEISQYKLTDNSNPSKFFANLIYSGKTDFESLNTLDSSTIAWVQKVEDTLDFGKSMLLKKDQVYMLTSEAKIDSLIEGVDVEVSVLADYKTADSTSKIQLVISSNDFYRSDFFENSIYKVNHWQNYLSRTIIPYEKIKKGDKIKVYFWNPDGKEIWIDNYKLLIAQ